MARHQRDKSSILFISTRSKFQRMNLSYIIQKYNTHAKCVKHLEKVRWHGTPVCPFCDKTNVTPRHLVKKSARGRKRKNPSPLRKTPLYHCNNCNKDFTVLRGTIFDGSKMPLPKWYMLIALMVNAKKGISALQISRDLNITYKSAWYSAMRVRCAMLDQGEMLKGVIEADSMYVGGKPRHRNKEGDESAAILSTVTTKRGKGTKKVPVVGFVEREGAKRIVLKMFNNNPTSKELIEMLKKHVKEDETILMTDEAPEFKPVGRKVQKHESVNHREKEYVRGAVHTNTIEGFWSMFKNGLRGQYHVLSKKYLPFYLAEFAFKYNMRNNQDLTFMETIERAVNDEKCTVKYKPKRNPRILAYGRRKKKRPCGKKSKCV